MTTYPIAQFLQFARSFNDWGPFMDGRSVADGQIIQSGQCVGWWQRAVYMNGGAEMSLQFDRRMA